MTSSQESMHPLVSIVLPVYNAADFLAAALNSLLSQTYQKIEILAIDDGSSDSSKSILQEYANTDNRIRLFFHEKNQGIAHSLNQGLDLAEGKYIARMDADDISRPKRIARQVAFMEKNPEVGLCGSRVRYFGAQRRTWRLPLTNSRLKCRLFWDNSFSHPATILRREMVENNKLMYDSSFTSAQDYDLWVRCSRKFKIANLPNILLNYRLHPKQVGSCNSSSQEHFANKIRLRQVEEMGVILDQSKTNLHLSIVTSSFDHTSQKLEEIGEWLVLLNDKNRSSQLFDIQIFEQLLAERWAKCCRRAAKQVRTYRRIFKENPLYGAATTALKLSVSLKRLF